MKKDRSESIAKYADERAFNRGLINYGYVGENNGDCGVNNSKVASINDCNVLPTKVTTIGNYSYCFYCGRVARPIQNKIIKFEDYSITGYTCVCKGAMDEYEMREKVAELTTERNKYNREVDSKIKNLETELHNKYIDGQKDLVLRIIEKELVGCNNVNDLFNKFKKLI